MRNNFFLIILIFFVTKFYSQTIKGTVSDSLGAVPFANLVIKNKDNIVRQYTNTNDNGFYKLTIKKTEDSSYIEVATVIHEVKKVYISSLPITDEEYILDIFLKPRTHKLREVIIEKKLTITTKKDTVEYNPETFKDGTEKVVEDLLKKLPGIKVEDNGEIKFKGKVIKKLLLDGDDLFDSNYTIGTRNINVDMIEKVQGLENFEENSLLKGISDSEDVALNLILKKGKTDFSGNINAGLGSNNRYAGNASGILVNSKSKGFVIGSYNNIGQNSTPYDFSSDINSLEDQKQRDFKLRPLINEGYFKPFLDDSFHRLNKNLFTNINFLTKKLKKSVLKISGSFYTDEIKRYEKSISNITLNSDSFTINEFNNLEKKPNLYDFQLFFSNKEKNSFHWEYIGKVNYISTTYNSLSSNNDYLQTNTMESENLFFSNTINLTYKVADNKAFIAKILYSKNKYPQNLNLNPGTVISLEENIESFKENTEQKKNYSFANLVYITNGEKYNFSLEYNLMFREAFLNSTILNNNNENLDSQFNNNNTYKVFSNSLTTNFSYYFQKFAAKARASIIRNNSTLEDLQFSSNKEYTFVSPKISVIYAPNKKNKTIISYEYVEKLPEEIKIFSGIVQTNYRNFINGTPSLNYLRTHTCNVIYNYNDFFNLRQVNLGIMYNYRPNNYFNRTIINQDITITNAFIQNISSSDIGLNFSGEFFLNFLKTTFQVNSNYTWNIDSNIINDSDFRRIKNRTLFLNIAAKQGFNNKYYINNTTSFISATSVFDGNESTNTFKSATHQTKISYKNNTGRIRFNILGNYIIPDLTNTNNYFFLESELNYTSKNKKITYSIIGKNLTNNKEFTLKNVSDYSINTYSHNLIERYVMLKVFFSL
ncbi:hypothetical protein GN157_17160 [Flavobacterium rakeshii]|uniref:Outer membrane beta-barrel protein n=1 Tax=Flavobacterium rakeshii TaxID=1038845 RepID=A0A6N8HI79_9FLAO|nr:TonB-dependent receptor [Flavobacterium rakeshii]MUV05445.1 hypothetical protein [Flavobacterium rakeshii]